jgi:hypothetical protein
VGGICVGDTAQLPIDEGCKIVAYPIPHDDHHKKTLVRVASPEIPGVFQPTFHYDCAHNQLRSVLGRVIGVVPKPSMSGIARLQETATRVMSRIPPCNAQDILDMPNRYSGAKRTRYLDAVDRYHRYGVRAFDGHCTMFCKPERMDGHAKVNPDPRAIQFRSAVYCVALAQFLQPIEHHIYTMGGFSAGVPESRNIAKGLNQTQRAELLHSKMSHFRRPVVLSLDASRFDKHVSVDLLKIEHSVYLHSNGHFEFRRLLAMQLENRCKSSFGLKYVSKGRRCSGDMNTALGNCLIMLIMVAAYLEYLRVSVWDTLDDGDDCLLIVEEEVLALIQSTILSHFLEYGMTMKVENVATSLFGVIFCQSSVVEWSEARFKFVRDYRAVISKSLTGIRHWQDPKYRIKVLRAIGLCELVLNLGVPVLQSFAVALLRNVGRPKDIDLASDGLRSRVTRELRGLGLKPSQVQPRLISEEARLSFEVAFGCSVQDQRAYERFFDGWIFEQNATLHVGTEWDVTRWLSSQSVSEVYPLWQNAKTEA